MSIAAALGAPWLFAGLLVLALLAVAFIGAGAAALIESLLRRNKDR